uniref:G-protein coupled receptors family 1 profile domain-containing protein n=1 Tax=Trichogramma kaykai TaxID=54128 RepID=A0ABD2XK27_9HYME
MHNATNIYLANLSLSDLLLLIIGLPSELNLFWQQYPWSFGHKFCKIRAFSSETCSYVSVLTIVILATERYTAVCEPIKNRIVARNRRQIYVISISWMISLLSALPIAIFTTLFYIEYPPGSGLYSKNSSICAMLTPYMPKYPLYELSSIIFFLIPLFIISLLYIKMGLAIHQSVAICNNLKKSSAKTSPSLSDVSQTINMKKISKFVHAVALMFFFCWAPFHLQRLLYVYGQDADYYLDINEWLYLMSGCLYYSSTIVNPLLYNFVCKNYRTACLKLMRFIFS